jgi:hypothetical protein
MRVFLRPPNGAKKLAAKRDWCRSYLGEGSSASSAKGKRSIWLIAARLATMVLTSMLRVLPGSRPMAGKRDQRAFSGYRRFQKCA